MTRKKILFLDLEETVIDDFSKGWGAVMMNRELVKEFIRAEQPDQVRLFSFAISDEQDVRTFNKVFKTWLEEQLEVEFFEFQAGIPVFTTKMLQGQMLNHKRLAFDSDLECCLTFGKDMGFLHFVQFSPDLSGCECVLLDDSVIPLTTHFTKTDTLVRLINVEDL